MKKRVLRSIICFLLSVIMITECNLGAINVQAAEIAEDTGEDDFEEEIITASSYLYPFEEAVIALEELAANRNIQAVVYLADTITMRTLPEDSSEPVKNLASGDVVSIIGAGQDAGYNIWYQVSYQDEIEKVTGYVRKDNVACVDQEFTQWQESYVRSIGMFSMLRGGYSYSDIEEFPESYQNALYALKQKHPNWIFVKMNTTVDWKTLVASQVGNRSWIWTPGTPESWKAGATGTTNWSYASEGIIRYYLDPRNWLAENNVFQFELLGYNSEYHTVQAVESLLSGSFMANTLIEGNMTYAQAFVELGSTSGVSPFFLAARVLQEQGYSGSSALISGTYPGYEGYYNYYNIGAAGNSDEETIVNGLQRAKDKGWNTRYKALKAGINFLAVDYINVGQNTLYLQKFDVVGTIGTHQYMQNIQAPTQEGKLTYKAYSNKGLLSQAFIFRIPVYNNMPTKAVPLPGEEDKITLSSTSIDNLQVDSEITLRPYVNGAEVEGVNWSFTSSDPKVATVDNTGVVKALKAGETTITCKNEDDPDNPNVGTCKVTVIPADINLAELEIPVLDDITYNPNATLKEIVLPTGYTWVNPDMTPIVAQSAYGVTYSPDEEKYNPITFDITLNVKKKVLTSADYTVPTNLEGGASRELGSVSLPIGFTWKNPQEKLADTIGTKEYLASYNPDSANYETATDIKIAVKIICEKHEFGEWKITEATCEADGTKVRKCTICGSAEELVLEKTGHLYEAVITKEPTEENEGTRTYTCKNCGDSYTEIIPKLPSAHVHKYEESIVKKASCTEEGEGAYECSCGDKYTEIIDATGHKVENGRCQQCGYTDVVETPDEDPDSTDNNSSNEGGSTGSGTTSSDSNTNSGTEGSGSNTNSGTTNSGTTSSDSNTNSGTEGSGSNTNSGTEDSGNTNSDSNTNSGTTNSGTTSSDSNTNSGTTNSGTTSSDSNTNSGTTNNNASTDNSATNNDSTNSSTSTNNGTTNSSSGSTNNTTTNSSSGSTNNTTTNSSTGSTNNTTTNSSTGSTNNTSNTNTTVNNSDTQNNSTATNNTTENTNSSATTNTVANNNASTTNTVVDNKTEENKTEENTVEENTVEENSTQTTTASTITQDQTVTTNETNQVEIELMSDLMEETREENADGEKKTVSIQLNKNTDISQKIVEMAKENGVDLEVKLSNELKWTIKADSLSGQMPSAVNMNAEIVQEVIDKQVIESVTSGEEYMELSLSHNGEFGFEATLTIPVEEKYVGQIANLFYFNEKTGELEFQMDTPVDTEGNIQLFFNHASDYVIVFSQNSMADVVTTLNVSSDSNIVETTKDMPEADNQKEGINKLLIVCVIIMVLAGSLAGAGYFIYFNKKEISDGQDFEAWLKEDKKPKAEQSPEKKAVSNKKKDVEKKEISKQEKKSESKQEEYLDDDVDDYKEKEVVSESLSNTGRIFLNKEISSDDYLDDDVDDYKEKM